LIIFHSYEDVVIVEFRHIFSAYNGLCKNTGLGHAIAAANVLFFFVFVFGVVVVVVVV
jgi:hypothetical protein